MRREGVILGCKERVPSRDNNGPNKRPGLSDVGVLAYSGMGMSVSEVWKILRPFDIEFKDFRSADIASEQRRVVGRESKPVHDRSGSEASHIFDINYVFSLAVAQPKSNDALANVLHRIVPVLKVDVLSVM